MGEDDSFREVAEDVALAKDGDGDRVVEPFAPLIEELGIEEEGARGPAEQILVYRESPERECFVCGESLPSGSRSLDEGEQYLIQRENVAGSPFPLTERTFHADCWTEYRD